MASDTEDELLCTCAEDRKSTRSRGSKPLGRQRATGEPCNTDVEIDKESSLLVTALRASKLEVAGRMTTCGRVQRQKPTSFQCIRKSRSASLAREEDYTTDRTRKTCASFEPTCLDPTETEKNILGEGCQRKRLK